MRFVLFTAVPAFVYSRPRLSRHKSRLQRRRFKGAYHACVRLLRIRRKQRKMTRVRLRRYVNKLYYKQLSKRRPIPRRDGYGKRPSKTSRQLQRAERAASVSNSLRWREVHFPFGLYYSKTTVSSFFDAVDPLLHFHSVRDFVHGLHNTVTDGVLFPHRTALVTARQSDLQAHIHY